VALALILAGRLLAYHLTTHHHDHGYEKVALPLWVTPWQTKVQVPEKTPVSVKVG